MISTILMVWNRPFVLWTETPNLNKARPWLKDKLRAYWIKLVFRNAVAVMSTGKPGCEAMAKMGCPKGKIINFPYWTTLPTEWSDCNNISKTSTIFFSIGRLDKIKGYDLAIRTFGKIVHSGNRKNIEYWLFGDGPKRQALEALAEGIGIAKKVKFYGWQDPGFIQKKN